MHGQPPATPASLAAAPAVAEVDNIHHSTELQGALADMLNAWYQSGYATGRYQTLLALQARAQESAPPSTSINSELYTDTNCSNS